ncbi:MAG TPA: PTS sugar transporter subunit IIA [Longimicrobium sp.]|nr:PTS sugar transporter subunit IIA [Longimicrobium sp.]
MNVVEGPVNGAGAGAPGASEVAGLVPERVTVRLPRVPYREALEALLRPEFDGPRLREVAGGLAEAAGETPSQLVPGVVFPSVRIDGIDEPMVFAGACPEGIVFPHATEPAKLLFALVSPKDDPEEHLEHLAEVARRVAAAGDVDRLCRCSTPAELFAWFRREPPAIPPEVTA